MRTLLLVGLVWLVAMPVRSQVSLAELDFNLVGVRLEVDPPLLTVPKDIATFVNTALVLPEGAGAEAQVAVAELADGAAVLAELRGPELEPTTISALPGEPLQLPPFHLAGDYFLDDIRLVKGGEVVLQGSPRSVPIAVIGEILVSSVVTRELSLEEIEERGIVIDARSFRALEFEAAFVIDGAPVKVTFPVLMPRPASINVPGSTRPFDPVAAYDDAQRLQQLRPLIELPPELDRPGLNLYLVGAEFVAVEEGGEPPSLQIPPIPALLLIPGNIAYLNQFFSAIVIVENGAPDGSGLRLRELTAAIRLPLGRDQVAGTLDDPGDDPVRLARTQDGVASQVPILGAGVDGSPGTGDDSDVLLPGQIGQGEFLIEGLREGTHVFDVDLGATLLGLPSGPVRLQGQALGTVQVRNATFSLTLGQPQTVLSGEPYDLFATVTNTSERIANLVSVNLDPRAISGALLESPASVVFETLEPGESAIATFRLRSQRSGAVTFSQITSEPGLTTDFALRTGVDERDVPLSPDALVLPVQANRVPQGLVVASQRVLGQAYAAATAPVLPPGVRSLPRRTVYQRARELAGVSIYDDFQLSPLRGVQELALDWLGNALGDPGFEQLLRTTEAGDVWADAVAGVLADELPGAGALEQQREFEEVVVYRGAHLSAALGDGSGGAPARLRVTNALGQFFERGPDVGRRARTLPFSQSFLTDEADGRRRELLVVGRAATGRYTVEVFGTAAGNADLGVALPSAAGELVLARFVGLPTGPASHFALELDTRTPAALVLRIDQDGDGAFESTRTPSSAETLREGPPEILGVRLNSDVSEAFVYNACSAHFGRLVDVLFSKLVTAESAQNPASWSIEAHELAGVVLQPTGRVVSLLADAPLGALIPRTLTAQGITDARGNISGAVTLPIADLQSDGARLIGRVSRADGRPVPRAILNISAVVNFLSFGGCTLAQLEADENGNYALDFLRETDSPLFFVDAYDPANGDTVRLQSRVRFPGGTEVINPVFRGRGRVVGRVYLSDGITPAGPSAVNLYPDFYSVSEPGRGVYADANGEFAFDDVPVGLFSIHAKTIEWRPDEDGVLQPTTTGPFATLSARLRQAGETLELAIITTERPPQDPGTVHGRVFLSGGVDPAVGFPVYLGAVGTRSDGTIEIRPIAETVSDETGSFEFKDVAPGGQSVAAIDSATLTIADAVVAIRSREISGVNLVFGAVGSVAGAVRDASGNLVPGALVSGGFELVTADANGFYRIPAVPIGRQIVSAGNPSTRKTGSKAIDVFPGQETFAEIVLIAAADIIGTVRDTFGNPVPGATVRIPVPGAGYFKAETDALGRYVFPNMGLGDWTVSASGRGGSSSESTEEYFNRLRDELGEGIRNRSLEVIRAAFQQALEVFVGTRDLAADPGPPPTPGNWGYTRVISGIDGVAAVADIAYIPVGSVGGVTVDGNGLATRAAMELMGLRLDRFGSPVFATLAFFDSQTSSGAFRNDFVPYGPYLVKAARPFSTIIVSESGGLGQQNREDLELVLRFPPANRENVLVGRVFEPDGVTPVGEDVAVEISIGDPPLTPLTDPNGFFDSQLPLPDGVYTLTAVRAATNDKGQVYTSLVDGRGANVAIRLLGRSGATVVVQRPDGSAVAGAQVVIQGSTFPLDPADGATDANGRLHVAALREGQYQVLATEGDQLTGRGAFEITQEDALAGREGGTTVTLRGHGTVSGTFYEPDGVTPIADAQISLHVEGVSVVTGIGPAAAMTTTGPTGRFVYDRVPVGDLRVVGVDPRNRRVGEARARLEQQGDSLELALVTRAIGRVRGRVLEADGLAPVPGATVSIQPTRLPGAGERFPSITAGPDGSFAFDGVPDGEFEVRAYDGRLPQSGGFAGAAVGSIDFEDQLAEIEVRTQPNGMISGRVLGTDGVTPASNVLVRIKGPTSLDDRESATDALGRFTFGPQHLGLHLIRAQSLDPFRVQSGAVGEIELTRHGEVLELDLILGPLGDVEVSVVDASGTPVALANVAITSESAFAQELRGGTGPNGEPVLFSGIPIGRFTVGADSPNLRVGGATTGAVVAAGETVAVTVELGPTGSVLGRLVLPDGITLVPGARATVRFAAQVGTGTLQVLSDALGSFELTHIPVGEFRFEATESISGGRVRLAGAIAQNEEVVDLGDVQLDLFPPRIVATDPPQGALHVPIDATIALFFDEPMDPDSLLFDDSGSPFVNDRNVWLVDGSGNKLHGSAELSADGTVLTIEPRDLLASQTPYRVVVRGGPGALADRAAGRELPDAFTLGFTSIDSVPPQLLSAFPAGGASGVPADAIVRLAFDEAMDSGFTLELLAAGGAPIAGSVTALLGGTVAVFTPAAPLPLNTSFSYRLGGARDLAGNALADGVVQNAFATLDTRGPTVRAIERVGGGEPAAGTLAEFEALVDEPDAVRVDLSIDDVPIVSDVVAPFRVSAALALGRTQVRVRAVALDSSGNRGPPLERSFAVSADARPTIGATASEGTSVLPGQSLRLDVTAADDTGIARILLSSIGALRQSTSIELSAAPTSFSGEVPFQIPAGATAVGAATLQLVAIDRSGQASDPATIPIQILDGTAPVVQITGPPAGATVVPGSAVSVSVSATDAVGVASLALECTPVLVGCDEQVIAGAPAQATRTFSLAIPATLPGVGQIRLVAHARDAGANEASSAPRLLLLPDQAPPSVAILSPADGSGVLPGASVSVSVSASDDVGLAELVLDATVGAEVLQTRRALGGVSTTSTSLAFTVPPTAVATTPISIVVTARDLSGGSASASRTLTVVAPPAPRLVELLPANGEMRVSVGITPSAAFDRAVANAPPDAFRLLAEGGVPVAASLRLEAAGLRVVLEPVSPLAYSAGYTLELTAGLSDASGQPVLSEIGSALGVRTHVFTTEREPSAPLAEAGADLRVEVGAQARLDASASSDPDGDTLSYAWSFVERPPASSATLDDASAIAPSFAVDVAGEWLLELRVSDASGASDTDQVRVSTENARPIAAAGDDVRAERFAQVRLDGRASSDADGDPLTYAWTLVGRPETSNTALAGAATATPLLMIDADGDYQLELVVSDGTLASEPDRVTVSTLGTRPRADAGLDRAASPGESVRLDGSASSDADGDALGFLWNVIARPAGSAAALDEPTAVAPRLALDAAGTYVVQLLVADGSGESAADTVAISTENVRPVANAGRDRAVAVGAAVRLDASASSDADGDALELFWTIVSAPASSQAELDDPAAVAPRFVPDVAGDYVLQLIVSDGALESAPDSAVVSTLNGVPLADAGAPQRASVGESVALDGGASSDPDGDLLAFDWSFVSRPPGSQAALDDPSSARPRFSLDEAGDYLLQLHARDFTGDGSRSSTLVSTRDLPPTADAGADRSVSVGVAATLDGQGSVDPDGASLDYRWSLLVRPAGSSATLTAPTTATPGLLPDVAGTYVVELVVSDGVSESAPDSVLLSTANLPPRADAGPDRSARTGDLVPVDGGASSDPDGDPLDFAWSLVARPTGSAAVMLDPTSATGSILVDRRGSYVAQLLARDGTSESEPDTAVIDVQNGAPVARAGDDRSVGVGASVTLDGGTSSDPDGDPLVFAWTLSASPAGSAAVLDSPSSRTPTFSADLAGDYELSLVVSDAEFASPPDTVVIHAGAVVPTIASIAPASGARGTSVEAIIAGSLLDVASGITFDGGGVTGTVLDASPNSVSVRIDVDVTAALGPRSFQLFGLPTGDVSAPAGVTFTVTPQALLELSLAPSTLSLVEGASAELTLGLSAPAGASGQLVALVSSVPGTATVAESALVPAGATSVAVPVAAVSAGPTTTITASGPGLVSASAQVAVRARPALSFAPTSLVVGVGRSETLALNLAEPAPAGGLSVSLQSTPAGVVSVASPMIVPAGASSAQVAVSGAAAGDATLTAQADGYQPASASISVRSLSLLLPPALLVTPGRTASLPVRLSEPAPAGGLSVTLVSSDPTRATVSSPVGFAAGESAANATLSGIAVGASTISASAAGYDPAQTAVSVETVTLSFVPEFALSTNVGLSATSEVRISRPAPAGGIAIALASADPAIAGVSPAEIVIPEGQTSGGVVQATISGVAEGSTSITASANGIAPVSLTVNVGPRPRITFASAFLETGAGLASSPFTNHVLLDIPAPLAGVAVTITSSDPGRVRVAPEGGTTGAATAVVTIPSGQSLAFFRVIGVSEAVEAISLTASSPGFESGTASVSVRPRTLTLSSVLPERVAGTVDPNPSVSAAYIASSGEAVQQAAVVDTLVTLANTNPAAATTPPTVTIPAGATNAYFSISALAAGTATFTASAPGFLETPDSSATTVVSAPTIAIWPPNGIEVGAGLGTSVRSMYVLIDNVAPPAGVAVTLTSSDPGRYLVAPDGSTSGAATAVVTIPSGQTLAFFRLIGVSETGGSIPLAASASFYSPATRQVTVRPATLAIFGLDASTVVGVGDSFVNVRSAYVAADGTAVEQVTLASTVVTLASSSPSVGTVPPTVTLPAGATLANFAFSALAAGTTTLTATAPGFVATPASSATTVVTGPAITFSTLAGYAVGAALGMPAFSAYLLLDAAAPPGGLDVTLTSGDPSRYLVAADAGTSGAETAVLTVPAGQTFAYFRLIGVSESGGAIPLSASAPFYSPGATQVTVWPATLALSDVQPTRVAGSEDPYPVVYAAYATEGGGFALQEVLADTEVTLANTNPAAATVPPTVTIPAGGSYASVPISALAAGTTTFTASAPGFVETSVSSATTEVTAPALSFSASAYTVGEGLGTGIYSAYVYTDIPAPAGGLDVTITSSAGAIAHVAELDATSGAATVVVTIPEGDSYAYFRVLGVGIGGAALTASASGFLDATASVDVRPAGLYLEGLFRSFSVGQSYAGIFVYSGYLNAQGMIAEIQPVLADRTVTFTSANPSVGTIGASAVISANQYQSSPVTFDAVSPGQTTVTASGPGFTDSDLDAQSVTVNP